MRLKQHLNKPLPNISLLIIQRPNITILYNYYMYYELANVSTKDSFYHVQFIVKFIIFCLKTQLFQ
jgi:hypothetical protein